VFATYEECAMENGPDAGTEIAGWKVGFGIGAKLEYGHSNKESSSRTAADAAGWSLFGEASIMAGPLGGVAALLISPWGWGRTVRDVREARHAYCGDLVGSARADPVSKQSNLDTRGQAARGGLARCPVIPSS
jgi:hypothetical protein